MVRSSAVQTGNFTPLVFDDDGFLNRLLFVREKANRWSFLRRAYPISLVLFEEDLLCG